MKNLKRTAALLYFVVCVIAGIELINCLENPASLCIEIERQALLSFKQSLDDPSNLLSSWNVTVDCCRWERVVCDTSTGHVHELQLQSPDWSSRLGGEINHSLLNLTRLSFLDLSQNNFVGTQIPSFIGSLVSLEYLNLSSAEFQGIVPPRIGNLSNLRSLGLSGVLEVDNMSWLSGLSRLEYLDLNYVNLSKVPDLFEIVNTIPLLIELHLSDCSLDHIDTLTHLNFSNLVVLDLSSNDMTSGVPDWIFSLRNIVSLDLRRNNFVGQIPVSAASNMSKLRYLDLSQNHFNSSIPDWLYKCNSLEFLSLSMNSFSGSISNSIANLSSLRSLDLSGNEFSGKIPWQVGKLCNLQNVELSINRFEGELSETFGVSLSKCFLASLATLGLRTNRLTGQLTEQLGEFQNIQTLDLGNNTFTGAIPLNLGSLSSLEILRLDNNKLTGNFPVSFGQLSNLEVLVMENNQMEGVVSEDHFSNLTKLDILSASGNRLTLRVPQDWSPPFQLSTIFLNSWNVGTHILTWLKSQRSISGIDLSQTGIAGGIPDWFWNLSSISSMNLSHNQLQGELPEISGPNWVYLSSNRFTGPLPQISYSVTELDLSNNYLSGGLPEMLCSSVNKTYSLTILHLGKNRLSGQIPDCWMNWPSLTVINLGNNNLSGGIPLSLGLLVNLLSLNLYDNSLSGEIPSLQNCTSLIKLDLSGNELQGGFPAWIGTSLWNLRILILRDNMFEGEIGEEICELSFLHVLDLADNMLSGFIPKCFRNLTAMTSEIKLANYSAQTYYSYFLGVFMESASVATKGNELQYDTILSLFSSIDLSNNQLSGQLPTEITVLAGLRSLNLSENHFSRHIPDKIGDMGLLESLDLSRNQLSGEIPRSMATLTFLNYLNLSHNELSGRIPLSTQLQSFGMSSFTGNELCGPPLDNNCTSGNDSPGTDQHDKGSETEVDYWLFVCIALGIFVGFWGSCGTLILKKSWRMAYFEFLDCMWRKLCP